MTQKIRSIVFRGRKNKKQNYYDQFIPKIDIDIDKEEFEEKISFFSPLNLNDISNIKTTGDIYKGVQIYNGETRIYARIGGETQEFSVLVCDQDIDEKIKNAYSKLRKVLK